MQTSSPWRHLVFDGRSKKRRRADGSGERVWFLGYIYMVLEVARRAAKGGNLECSGWLGHRDAAGRPERVPMPLEMGTWTYFAGLGVRNVPGMSDVPCSGHRRIF